MNTTLTSYHTQYYAYELMRSRTADDQDKFTASLQDATVDLNPHQVEAALFAFKSPLYKGALLADEVGLGKTIEAGIIPSRKWADDKRKSLKAELKEYDDQIAILKKEARFAQNLPDKLAIRKSLRDIDKKRDEAWKSYDEASKHIERQKDELLDIVEQRFRQTVEKKPYSPFAGR